MTLDPRALCTLAEAKDWLNVATAATAEDSDIETAINNVSQRLHVEAEREFKVAGSNPQTRTFVAGDLLRADPWYVDGQYMGTIGPPGSRTVRIGDNTTITSVELISPIDWTTSLGVLTTAQYRVLPLVREEWEPITGLEFRSDVSGFYANVGVKVAGNWGFPSVPGSVKQACLDGVAWTFDRDVEHYRQDMGAAIGGAGGGGPVIMTLGGAQRILSLPTEVLAAAWAFRPRK